MIIQPVLAPSLTNLTASPTLKGNLLKWDVVNSNILLGAEVWASKTNSRATATKIAEVIDNTYMHFANAGETWYYWVRSISVYNRADGNWLPSATVGAQATTLLAQTDDIAQNAVTDVTPVQSVTSVSQSSYSIWERVFTYQFFGTGNYFIIDFQHLSNLSLATLGTTGSAHVQQRLGLNEYTIHQTGLVNVTNGSAIVTGIGTSWLGQISAGHIFSNQALSRYTIQSVDSNTQITLTTPFGGATATNSAYYIITSSGSVFTLTETTDKFYVQSGQYLSHSFPYRARIPVITDATRLYDVLFDWAMIRTDTSWSMSNQSVLRTMILEEVKR